MDFIAKDLVAKKIASLIRYAVEYLNLSTLDSIYAHNQLLELFEIDAPEEVPETFEGNIYSDILTPLTEYAFDEGIIDEVGKKLFPTKVMGLVTPAPSICVEEFDKDVADYGVRIASQNFYKFCERSTYINREQLNKNFTWTIKSVEGDLSATINVSRPEKDPKEIAAAKAAPQTGYPKCMLCAENLGYPGRANFPARQTLRYIPIPLADGSLWFMQYSPYNYFDQHCIFFSYDHKPMTLGEDSFARMVELLQNFPHYFIGSNAPLPIVGGSILAHDHYQGGAKVMPEFTHGVKRQYTHPSYPGVTFSIVDWYNSVVRIKTKDFKMGIKAVNNVNKAWAKFNAPNLNILSHTDDVQHNAITPVFRMERGYLVAELFLRNNRTDEAHPYGIFHPTEEYHHVKKEGIGVIEVMGCFVLPGKIATVIREISRLIRRDGKIDPKVLNDPNNMLYPYRDFLVRLISEKQINKNLDERKAMLNYLGDRCIKILKSTAVFKDDPQGQRGFNNFMRYMGCVDFDNELPGKEKARKKEEYLKQKQRLAEKKLIREKRREQEQEKTDNATPLVMDERPQPGATFVPTPKKAPVYRNYVSSPKQEVPERKVIVEGKAPVAPIQEQIVEPVKRGRGRPKKIVEDVQIVVDASVEDAVTSIEDAPKRRGRPRKVVDDQPVENSPVVQENREEAPVESVKRGRGRPKKVEEVQSIETSPIVENQELSAEAPKRRGRPRKVVEDVQEAPVVVESDVETPKRGRGRPKKNV